MNSDSKITNYINSASLSVVVVCQDEEKTIAQVLQSVKSLATEIIVVDSGSIDKTVEIAKALGAKVLHQDWLGYSAQKNFAIGLASNEWILSLDADEVVTPDLVSEIRDAITCNDHKINGFKINRILFIGDKPLQFGGFSPDPRLRLFRKGEGQFNDRLVHEAVFVSGLVKKLKYPILHYSYANLQEFAQAMDKFAKLSAQEFVRSGYSWWKASWWNECLHPIWTFVYRYVFRLGFLDGVVGLKATVIYSNYVRCKISYLRKLINSKPA